MVREADACRDFGQSEVLVGVQELLRPRDPTCDDVSVRRHSGGRGELPREVTGALVDDRGQLVEGQSVSERALRPAVLWGKGSFESDSEAGSRFAERLLTVVATCRQQGRSLLNLLTVAGEAALRGTAALSLLGAGQGS